jgi:hypothetical protein
MILSALFGRVITYYTNSGGYRIGNTDKYRLTTLFNSASTAPQIGLLPKGAKFCHTLNILVVGHQCRHALSWLYFNASAVGWSLVVGQLVGPQ